MPLGLTRRSSGPAKGGPLTFIVSLLRIHMPTAQVMSLSIAVTHSQVLPLVLSRSAGLRLLGSGHTVLAWLQPAGYGLLSSGASGVARSLRVSAAIMRIETSTCDGMMRA